MKESKHSKKALPPRITVRFKPDVSAWLRRAAAKKGCNVSELVRRFIGDVFERRHAKDGL